MAIDAGMELFGTFERSNDRKGVRYAGSSEDGSTESTVACDSMSAEVPSTPCLVTATGTRPAVWHGPGKGRVDFAALAVSVLT